MTQQQKTFYKRIAIGARGGCVMVVGLVVALVAIGLFGCADQEAAPPDMPPAIVGPVEVAGANLNADASPKQVAAALLQLLRADVEAAQRDDWKTQRQRLFDTIHLAAPKRIYMNVNGAAPSPATSQKSIDQVVYRIVYRWAPIVARYVESFPKQTAGIIDTMREQTLRPDTARVSIDVTDPITGDRVALQVFLQHEAGAMKDKEYWRVYRLGYAPIGDDNAPLKVSPQRIVLTPSPTTKPTTQPAAHP